MSQVPKAVNRMKILALYRQLLRESQKFSAYNFRMYAIRRTRDGFRAGKELSSPDEIQEAVKFAESNLAMIKRQVIIGQVYPTEQLVIENKANEITE